MIILVNIKTLENNCSFLKKLKITLLVHVIYLNNLNKFMINIVIKM